MTFTLPQTIRNTSRSLFSALALTAVLGIGANLLGVTPVQAHRLDAKDDATYTIKRVYKAGEIDRYRLTTKMNMDNPQLGGAVEASSNMLIRDVTKEVKDDGSTTSISEFENASVTFAGNDLDITTMLPKIITTRDKSGKSTVKMEGGNEQITAQMGDQVQQLTLATAAAYLPNKPIKVGDTWDMDTTSTDTKDQKIKGKVTLVSIDTVKGVKVAKLKSITDVTSGMDTKMHSEATTLVDVATGKPLSATTKTDGEAAGGKVNIEMTLKMLGPDEKSDTKEAAKPSPAVKKP